MRRVLCLGLLCGACVGAGNRPLAAKPNILVIYSDDHGWADLGTEGVNADIRTPHLDQLSRDGVRFARGYVSAPQCVPSRAGLLTGRYQQKFGVEDNAKGPLPLEEVTIAERLKNAGYRTGMSGKWHLDMVEGSGDKGKHHFGVDKRFMPHAHGFDEYWRGEINNYFASHDLQGKPFPDAPHFVTDGRFRVVVQTEAALAFLDRRAAKPEEPWCLYLAWFAPHVPLEAAEPWFSKTPANLPLKRRQALAMIAAMDEGLGQIRTKLRAMNAERNTLIFFIGDNGAPLGRAWDGSLNEPLVGQKGMLCEGGIRTPFVAAWPGHIPARTVYYHPVINLDVAATAAALAGLPRDDKLDGVNLMPFLTGEKSGAPHETLYWRWSSQAAILEFPYKLILLGNRRRLLFDVTTPAGESIARDLTGKHPETAVRLESKLRTWCGTLKPPGITAKFDKHHEGLFEEHGVIAKSDMGNAVTRDPNQGWICRDGTLAIRDGALVVTPDAKAAAKPFITKNRLSLAGPLEVVLRVRAADGGSGTVAWRTKQQADFAAKSIATFMLKKTEGWQDIHVAIPADGHIVHVRIKPPPGPPFPVFSRIELRPAKGDADITDFSKRKQ